MTETTIAALVGAAPLAIAEHGLPMLAMDLPGDEAVAPIEISALDGEAIQFERGQRFAVHRGVAFVPVRGVLTPNSAMLERYLGWATYHGLAETMAAVTASDEVQATVMLFDTPGGSVMGIQAAVQAVRAAVSVKPVHGLVHPLAASAGYWLASQCSDLSATPGSWVGSVGTMATMAQPMQPGSGGDQVFIQTSAHAGAKRPDPSTDEGKQLTQMRLDEMEGEFLAGVSEGRKIAVEDLPGRMSRTDNVEDGGDVFWGADAISRGLVDAEETLPDFLARIGGLYAPKPRGKTRAAMALAEAAQAQASL
ncbi:S49 family peptidase [Pseudophaeobacter sp.]|jgi:ClpP class serine protease|uniref:S49 family peptidase n=1 Tax=Pseudophaeobacter sp. TaxID=1971739 RepID=UPI0032D9A2B3